MAWTAKKPSDSTQSVMERRWWTARTERRRSLRLSGRRGWRQRDWECWRRKYERGAEGRRGVAEGKRGRNSEGYVGRGKNKFRIVRCYDSRLSKLKRHVPGRLKLLLPFTRSSTLQPKWKGEIWLIENRAVPTVWVRFWSLISDHNLGWIGLCPWAEIWVNGQQLFCFRFITMFSF